MSKTEINAKIKNFLATCNKIFGDLSKEEVNKKYLNGELKHDESIIADIVSQLENSGLTDLEEILEYGEEGYEHISKTNEEKIRKYRKIIAEWAEYTEKGFAKMLKYAGYPQKKVKIIFGLDLPHMDDFKEQEAKGELYLIQ